MTFLQQVDVFHRQFQIPEPPEPIFAPEVIQHRYRLMREEAQEYYDAQTPHDVLDALLDFAYVHAGSILELGLKANYAQVYEARYPAPAKVREDLLSLCERFGKGNGFCILTLADMQYEMEALVKEEGFEPIFEEAFVRVQARNLDKFWNEQEVVAHQLAGNCEGWEYLPARSEGIWICKYRGKVKKPANWQPPDFSDLLNKVATPT